jgi:hypothetical protein
MNQYEFNKAVSDLALAALKMEIAVLEMQIASYKLGLMEGRHEEALRSSLKFATMVRGVCSRVGA